MSLTWDKGEIRSRLCVNYLKCMRNVMNGNFGINCENQSRGNLKLYDLLERNLRDVSVYSVFLWRFLKNNP